MSQTHLTIPNLKELGGGVWTAGQPSRENLEQAKDAGFNSVITLCPQGECGWDEKTVVEQLGMRYSCIPISSGGDLSEASARALHVELESSPRPVLVHCGSANRVGALFALKAHFVDGHPPETALDHGRRAGLVGLEAAVRQILRS